MSASSLGVLFTVIGLTYIVAQLILIAVAISFWKRYPRPSLYLVVMASIELSGSGIQTALLFVMSWGVAPNGIYVQVLVSLIRLAAHLAALFFLVMAVYVARRPSQLPTNTASLPMGAPGMENGDPSFLLDPKNPYSPPRQPR